MHAPFSAFFSQDKIGVLQEQQGVQRKNSSAMMSEHIQVQPRCGYLTKRAIKSGRNWKQRYFILHESALVYTTDEYSAEKVGGIVRPVALWIASLTTPFFTAPPLLCACALRRTAERYHRHHSSHGGLEGQRLGPDWQREGVRGSGRGEYQVRAACTLRHRWLSLTPPN